MSTNPNQPRGRIILHGDGVGDLTLDDIERRAQEIALIHGRPPERVTEDDRERAWEELQNRQLRAASDNDGESRGAITRDPSEPASIPGRQIANQEGESDPAAIERLAYEGVEEAQHDQMLAAREREHRQDRR
ncbi:MAG TPA: hypothetical protein VEB66_02710 [Opitutaceae bacterium]|nr:hypothetical protein [Opitutaceae bacterium]